MITFKGKEYPLKTLFIRDEAKLAQQYKKLSDDDMELKADGMIEVCKIFLGIDIGDLNGSTIAEVNELMRQIMVEREAAKAPEAPVESGNVEAPNQGAVV